MVVYADDLEIVVNGGHGILTAGKRTPLLPKDLWKDTYYKDGHMREWEFNHATSKYLQAELIRCGFRTIHASDTTADTALSTRVGLANKRKSSLYVSIHANAAKAVWGDWGGIETFAYPKSKGWEIAEVVQKDLIAATKLRNRGVKDGSHLYEINHTSMPCILVECGFMDNLPEAELLLKDSYRRLVAATIAKALCKYYGVSYKAAGSSTPTSNKGDAIGTVKTLVDELWYYDKPDWDAKKAQLPKGTVLTIAEELTVNGSKMYKTISGTYITAYKEYVQFTPK
jgi:N-acetylmuramoyl-L-alanine amidase